jgi:prepilin-type N-terminal cleavage/methylation domain-containing protein
MKRAKKAFTLIELLVVIAIIAILAAILFPVFAQAKLAAKKAVAVSDQKQIGLGMIMYSNDFDDSYPQAETGDSYNLGHPHITWSTMIYPYVKNGDQNLDKDKNGGLVCTAKGGLYVDPAAPQIDQTKVGAEGYYFAPNRLICPANYQGGETWFAPNGQLVVPMTTTQLPTPADTVLLSEKGLNPIGGWQYPFLMDQQSLYIGSIAHTPGNASTVYRDGNDSMTPTSPVYSPLIDTDCTSANTGSYDCAATPRYRYAGQSVFSFADGHTKAVPRGGLKWFKNIYVQRGDIPSTNWVYGYYASEPN